ncbi:MAG: DUF1080 domain-containing protein [Planctomycetota bacterium]|nr:MAG: DUF1080 domain-containing protein [Planctomycetota bacterium]
MHRRDFAKIACLSCCSVSLVIKTQAADEGWIDLIGGTSNGLEAFIKPRGYWKQAASVTLDAARPNQLKWTETTEKTGIWVNGPSGRTNNLVSHQAFGDLEVMLDFNVPKGSNSGIKLQGLYEIQIYDSHGVAKEKFDASGMGGVYPRAELLPRYHHIDKGYPAKVNPSAPPGQWQSMHILFRAPKFDANGKKIASAKFEKVLINGQEVHRNLTVPSPTGHAYVLPEVAQGPIFLQGDHGPVAFRNVKVRPLTDRPVS